MRIGVLGAGSLGSLFAGRLAAAGTEVVVLGRANDHLQRIRADGIVVTTPDGGEFVGEVDATTEPSDLAGIDVLLVCVKSYDTDHALTVVADALPPTADVVTLQNGLGNAETIGEHVPDTHVVAGTTTHGAFIEEPGRVRHAGGGDTRIGRFFGSNDDAVDDIAAAFTDAGIATTVIADVRSAIWEKVLVNAGINAATALARVPNGEMADGPGAAILRDAVEEGARVAKAEDVSIDPAIVDHALDVARQTATNRSSMLQDLEAGTRTEIDSINGELARRADEHDVPAPVNRTLTNLVRLAEDRG